MSDGILILDKPEGWTSFDAVKKLRGILRERHAGHAGTLDPMATGVLAVFLGRATRACEFTLGADKEYLARFTTGIETDTQDITGKVLSRSERAPGLEEVRAAISRFTGNILQTPPMYSAVRKDGKKLYELARRGVEVERPPRPVEIKSLALTGVFPGKNEYEILVTCSKGTYIRTLCHDIGRFLGCGACMSSLRRLRTGSFGLKDAHTLEEVAQAFAQGCAQALILPVESLFLKYPSLTLEDAAARALKNGAPMPAFPDPGFRGPCRVHGPDGAFLIFGELTDASGGISLNRIKSFY